MSRLLPSLALLIAVGIFFFYINPTWTGPIAVAKSAIALDNQALDSAQKYKEQQNVLIQSRDQIDAADLVRLTKFLPDSVDNVQLILDLNALAARSGLSISNIDVVKNPSTTGQNGASLTSAANTAGTVGSVNMTLSAVGTFTALRTFLARVENSARLLDVEDVVVKGSETGVYGYTMSIRLYWLR